MQVTGLFHYLVSAPPALLEECKTFYENVLGLVSGPRPQSIRPGYWMYAGDQPIVHLAEPRPGEEPHPIAGGHLDHVAFYCSDLNAALVKLDKLKVPYRAVTIDDPPQVQLVIKDPAGIVIELNFKNERLTKA